MEELFNKLNAKFTAYNWNKNSPIAKNETAEQIKSEIIDLLSIPVEKPVILQGELLPCPFCGGEASIGTTRIGCKRTAELNNRTNGFFVNCIICGSNNNFLHLGYATEEIAKEHWNKRAGREPQSK